MSVTVPPEGFTYPLALLLPLSALFLAFEFIIFKTFENVKTSFFHLGGRRTEEGRPLVVYRPAKEVWKNSLFNSGYIFALLFLLESVCCLFLNLFRMKIENRN